uniref:Uncharacterized protein n=1 Tax=Fagus sylvatica TaxID=28930 RepID=A0A2N9EY98_FAGSY
MSCTTEAIMESLMTMILVAFDESSRKSSAMGSRRCKEALNNGWRCEGNLFGVLGFGGGERKAWLGGCEWRCKWRCIVDWDVVGHDKTTEVEELVEMALCWKGHHDHHHFGFVWAIWDMVLMVLGVSH